MYTGQILRRTANLWFPPLRVSKHQSIEKFRIMSTANDKWGICSYVFLKKMSTLVRIVQIVITKINYSGL